MPTAKENTTTDSSVSISELVAAAKNDGTDIVQLLKNHVPVVEVAV